MNVRRVKIVLFLAILALGAATIVVTLSSGGTWNSRGILFGAILCAMALVRLFVSLRHES
jgi:hypothetical protein